MEYFGIEFCTLYKKMYVEMVHCILKNDLYSIFQNINIVFGNGRDILEIMTEIGLNRQQNKWGKNGTC